MNNLKIYEPDNSLKKGYMDMFKDIASELINNKWLIYQLFKRDISALYKQSLMGILWAFIIPIVSVWTFILLNQSGIFNLGVVNIPYPIFAIMGMAFWQLFSMGLIASTNSLVSAGSMVTKINFSKKSLVIASIGQSLISFIVQFALVCLLFIYYGFMPTIWILLIPLFILPVLLITIGTGFFLSLLNSVMRDIGSVLSLLLTFIMFLSPILYAKPQGGILALITAYNPLYYLVVFPRDLILTGISDEFNGYILSTILSIGIFIVGIMIFHLTETRISERV